MAFRRSGATATAPTNRSSARIGSARTSASTTPPIFETRPTMPPDLISTTFASTRAVICARSSGSLVAANEPRSCRPSPRSSASFSAEPVNTASWSSSADFRITGSRAPLRMNEAAVSSITRSPAMESGYALTSAFPRRTEISLLTAGCLTAAVTEFAEAVAVDEDVVRVDGDGSEQRCDTAEHDEPDREGVARARSHRRIVARRQRPGGSSSTSSGRLRPTANDCSASDIGHREATKRSRAGHRQSGSATRKRRQAVAVPDP